MDDGGKWKIPARNKGHLILEGVDKTYVRSGCTISFTGSEYGSTGHIAFVERVLPNGTLIISEQNYDNKGSFRQRFVNKNEWLNDLNYFV